MSTKKLTTGQAPSMLRFLPVMLGNTISLFFRNLSVLIHCVLSYMQILGSVGQELSFYVISVLGMFHEKDR